MRLEVIALRFRRLVELLVQSDGDTIYVYVYQHALGPFALAKLFVALHNTPDKLNEVTGLLVPPGDADALGGHKPARATVEVSRLPKDVLVEIDAIAVTA